MPSFGVCRCPTPRGWLRVHWASHVPLFCSSNFMKASPTITTLRFNELRGFRSAPAYHPSGDLALVSFDLKAGGWPEHGPLQWTVQSTGTNRGVFRQRRSRCMQACVCRSLVAVARSALAVQLERAHGVRVRVR